MGLEESKKREYLIKIIKKVLETNIELMIYYKHCATDEKSKKVCNKSIKQTRRSLEKLPHIKHIEILQSLFNAIVGGKEFIFVSAGSLVGGKNVEKWDSTEKGFKEFIKLEEESKKAYEQKVEEERKTREVVSKAKQEGKKVSFALIDGKMKPIIEDEPKS